MNITPQPVAESFDAAWTARQLAAAGVCLADETLRPLGEADAFFADYALPRLLQGERPTGVLRAEATVQVGAGQTRTLVLLARRAGAASPESVLPARWAELTAALPSHNDPSLRRLASSLAGLCEPAAAAGALSADVEKLSGELADTYEEISLLYQTGGGLSVTVPAQSFLENTFALAAATMEVRGLGSCVWDNSLGEHPPLAFVAGGSGELTPGELARLDATLRDMVDADNPDAAVLVNETALCPPLAWIAPLSRQILAVPMRRHGRRVGCLFALEKDVPPEVFGTFNRGMFTSIDRKMLAGVALHVALYLENAKLFGDVQAMMMGLLHSLVAAVDAKDAYTCGHSVRVALFAKRLAEAAGQDAAACERVYFAGLLHDVGKIGVADAVLRKPGKLTDEEFAEIKRHPEIGHNILRNVPGIADVLPGVLHHHEKYDGRGYPHRLAGEGIPLLGRIMCIADSFDAMTSSRTYRAAMPIAAAMAEVLKCRGTQFDPELAELFAAIPESQIEALIEAERDGRTNREMILSRAA